MIFEEQSTIEHMVFRILTHTQSLIQCQRVQVLLCDISRMSDSSRLRASPPAKTLFTVISPQVLLVHKASKGSFSRVFDFEANDLAVEDSDSRTR